MDTPLAELRNVSKAYGGVRALDGVSLRIEQGEIHALCGENGAGKSTLNNILAGVVLADSGEIRFMGEQANVKSVRDAEKLGVTMIHQELVAFPHLAAPDNIFIGREPTKLAGLLLDRARMDRESADLIKELKEEISLTENLENLSTAARQMIGIARALAQESKLLIMDEPTASLSTRETEVLFQVIRDLKASGISVLYVSHRLNEVFEIADRVTVLKDGRFVATSLTADLTQPELIKLMVGRDIVAHTFEGTKAGEPRLVVKNLSVPGSFDDVSFEVKAGVVRRLAHQEVCLTDDSNACPPVLVGLDQFARTVLVLQVKHRAEAELVSIMFTLAGADVTGEPSVGKQDLDLILAVVDQRRDVISAVVEPLSIVCPTWGEPLVTDRPIIDLAHINPKSSRIEDGTRHRLPHSERTT